MSVGLNLQNIALLANARPWFSVEDYYDRADGALGTASDGRAVWTVLSGTFAVSNGKALAGASTPVATPADTGIAYVDILSIPEGSRPTEISDAATQATIAPASNVVLEADMSPTGGDALYFRIKDANNWHRVLLTTDVITTPVYTGYYTYDWNSSLGTALYVSTYTDPKKYFPTLTNCASVTFHDHSTIAAPNTYINDFDPANQKWGQYPYIAVKRGIRQGATGNDVRYLQGVLKYKGYYNAAIDGDFGPVTDAALRALQSDYDIIVDGFAWNLQSWIVVDRLAFESLTVNTAGVRGSESITSYVRRVLLGSVYDYPNKVVTGTSSVLVPDGAYTNLVHSHDLLLDRCQHVVPAGTHIHYATNTYNGASTFVSTAASTTVSSNLYKVVVQKCVGGSISTFGPNDVTLYNGYDNLDSEPITHLKVVAYDNYVEVYVNNANTPNMATWLATANPLLTKHGIGRGASTAKGTGIDNFICTPLEYFTVPSQ